jgi:TonB family protein
MITLARLSIVMACVVAISRPVFAQDALTSAKDLYDAASYREALAALDRAEMATDIVEVDKYRALCQLALGLPRDAEHSLEHLALNRPLYSLDGSDASPRLLALFAEVRKRTLPEAAKQTYQRGRTSFDGGDMADATTQFQTVMKLADTAPPDQAALLGDLKMLAGGFLKLSEAAVQTPRSAEQVSQRASQPVLPQSAPGDAAPSAMPIGATPVAAPSATRVYDATFAGARPPVSVYRPVPSFVRPDSMRNFAFREGLIELEIDEQGAVTSAAIKKSAHIAYDPILLNAASKWRFQPATVNGQPVKYRALIAISIAP